jgi:hypothetical protein
MTCLLLTHRSTCPPVYKSSVTNLFVTGTRDRENARDRENSRDQVTPTSHVTVGTHVTYHVTYHVTSLIHARHVIHHLTRTQAQYGPAHSLECSMNLR